VFSLLTNYPLWNIAIFYAFHLVPYHAEKQEWELKSSSAALETFYGSHLRVSAAEDVYHFIHGLLVI